MAASELPGLRQPDIDYYPDIVKYQKRTERRLQSDDLETVLRDGLPPRIDCPAAWGPSTAETPELWLHHLDADDIQEINQALARFQGR
jgi:hypothetical protein